MNKFLGYLVVIGLGVILYKEYQKANSKKSKVKISK